MSDFSFILGGFFTGIIFSLMIWLYLSGNKREPQEPRKIIIKYKDGNEETLTGMDWQRYDDVLTIYHYDMEEPAVKEINMDCIKSIGYANCTKGVGVKG